MCVYWCVLVGVFARLVCVCRGVCTPCVCVVCRGGVHAVLASRSVCTPCVCVERGI